MKDLLIFAQEQTNVFAKNLTSFIKGAKEQGFTMLAPGGNGNPVHASKAGNLQIAFGNNGKRIYLRLSTNVVAGIKAGEIKGIKDQPIYEIPLTQGASAGKLMLVIGVEANSDLKPMTTMPDLATLAIPETVGVEED